MPTTRWIGIHGTKRRLHSARGEDKPIFLSIGYSACHWCHVMEHESFEDEGTAALMNELFVNIKVDREERPDLDAIYMDAVQALTGPGRLAHERLPHAGRAALLWRHLLPAAAAPRLAQLQTGAGIGGQCLSHQPREGRSNRRSG